MNLSPGLKKTAAVCLLLIILANISLTTPVLAATSAIDDLIQKKPQCDVDYNQFLKDLGTYSKDNLFARGGLFVLGVTVGELRGLPYIGGAFEPVDDTINELKDQWDNAFVWGVKATFASWLTGKLILEALRLNSTLTSDAPFVGFGYGIIMDLMYGAVVIALILMAFGTILRLEFAKKTIAKIIITALLINFTMFLAGTILNIGTSLTEGMITATDPCVGSFVNKFNVVTITAKLDAAFSKLSSQQDIENQQDQQVVSDAQEIINSTSGQNQSWWQGVWNKVKGAWDTVTGALNTGSILGHIKDALATVAKNFLKALLSSYLGSVIAIIGALTFATIFMFLVIRYAVLALLIIFAPIIWLGIIFPKIKLGNWWWGQFLKWFLYGPFIVFSLGLTSNYIDYISKGGASGSDPLVFILQLLIAVIFSLGGLYAAQKMGTIGSEFIGMGVSAGVGIVGKAAQSFWQGQRIKAELDAKQAEQKGGSGTFAKLRGRLYGGLEKASTVGPAVSTIMTAAGLKVPKTEGVGDTETKRTIIIRTLRQLQSGFNPELVLQLANEDLDWVAQNGSRSDKKAVDKALARVESTKLNPGELKEFNRATDYVVQLSSQGKW
jgi:hypothetical protein